MLYLKGRIFDGKKKYLMSKRVYMHVLHSLINKAMYIEYL